MAWIESHQTLGQHPKTRKFARLLNVTMPTAVGHLQYFWWWAIDYAPDGDIGRHDPLDVAIGAEWTGDPDEFVTALVRAGFVDDEDDGLTIHDWEQYGGKLPARRRAARERMHRSRGDAEAMLEPVRKNGERVRRTFANNDAKTGERTGGVRGTIANNDADGERVRDCSVYRGEEIRGDNTIGEDSRTMRAGGAEPPTETETVALVVMNGTGHHIAEVVDGEQPTPFGLLAALLETLGHDVAELTGREKAKQLGIAKRMVADGVTEADVRGVARWLVAQPWVNGGVDLGLVESQRAKWTLAGKPERPSGARTTTAARNDEAFSRVLHAIGSGDENVMEA